MEFYNEAHASESRPERHEHGLWQHEEASPAPGPESSRASQTTPSSYTSLFHTQAASDLFNERADTNPTSISSIVTVHDYDADREEDNPKTPESDESISGRGTPRMGQDDKSQALVGIGDVHLEERLRRSRQTSRLEATHDKYGKAFVAYKERIARAKMRAAEDGEASRSTPYQLAVFRHDELSRSNDPEQINEERAAICAHIDDNDNHAGENCDICYQPPDYYDDVENFAVTEEETMMPAADVEWHYRTGNYDTTATEGTMQEE